MKCEIANGKKMLTGANTTLFGAIRPLSGSINTEKMDGLQSLLIFALDKNGDGYVPPELVPIERYEEVYKFTRMYDDYLTLMSGALTTVPISCIKTPFLDEI